MSHVKLDHGLLDARCSPFPTVHFSDTSAALSPVRTVLPSPLPSSKSRPPGRRSRARLLGTFVLLVAAAAAAENSRDAVVELERFITKSEKEQQFTLPLDAVAGTASHLGLSNRDMPASVSVIHQEQIQARGFRTAVEAVEGAVGMAGGTQFGSIPGYSTRGFTGNNITILRDGIRQNTASQSSRSIETFTLDRVEILKGPASLLYGEGAIGGAVNYLTKPAQHTAGGEAFASHSSWNAWRIGVGYGGPLLKDKLAFRFDTSRVTSDGYVDRNSTELDAFAGTVKWNVTPKLTTSFHGDFLKDSMESYYGQPVIYDAVIDTTVAGATPVVRKVNTATDILVNPRIDPRTRRTNYNVQNNSVKTENGFLRWKTDFKAGDSFSLQNMAYLATQNLKWINLENNTYNPATGLVDLTELTYIYRDDTLTGDRAVAVWDLRRGAWHHRLAGGFDLSRNDITRGTRPSDIGTALPSVALLNPEPRFAPAGRKWVKSAGIVIDTAAFFVEDLIEPNDKLKLVLGLRFDDIDIKRTNLLAPTTPIFGKRYRPTTGRVGAVWTVAPNLNVYASYSTAAEPVVQLVSLTATQNDFGLQKGRQYEIGLKQTFWQGRADATVALFKIEKNDLLTQTIVNGNRVSQQVGAQLSDGLEAAVSVAVTPALRLEANFAYTDASYDDFNETLGNGVISRSGKRPPNVAAYVSNLHLVYRWKNGLAINGGPRYVGERMANTANTISTPSYVTLDAAVSYTWRKTLFTLRGRNLLDEEFEEWATASGAMRRLADPRAVELTARYRF